MTEIDYKEKEKRLEVSVKIFSDDLQKAISKEKEELIEIGTDREHANATLYIEEYLRKNFKLFSGDKELKWEYVGRKLERQEFFAMWVFLKVEKVRKLKELSLYNNILIDFQQGQENKISFRIGEGGYKKFDTYKGNTKVKLLNR